MTGGIFLELGGQSYELRPGFSCIVALEECFNRPLLQIADMFIGGEASLKLIAEALAIILVWPPVMRAGLGEEIVASGVGKVLEKLQKFFLAALGAKGETGNGEG